VIFGVLLLYSFEESLEMNTESEKEIRCKTESVFKVCTVCKIKGDKLQVAPYFVCAFFSLETDRVSRVCSKCYGEAENHQSVLVNMLVDNKSVFTGPKKPKNQVEIVDLDDDDDVEFLEEHEKSREEVAIEEDVDDVVKYVMDKYCFGEQLNAASLHLRNYYFFKLCDINSLLIDTLIL
jgi:histone-lysine N-methyltransferase SETDB1